MYSICLAEQEKRREQIDRSLMGHRTKKAGRESESEGYEAVMELSRQVGKLTASVIPYFQLNQ